MINQTLLYHCDRCHHTTRNGGDVQTLALPAATACARITPRARRRDQRPYVVLCTGCQRELAGWLDTGVAHEMQREKTRARDLFQRQNEQDLRTAHSDAVAAEMRAQTRVGSGA